MSCKYQTNNKIMEIKRRVGFILQKVYRGNNALEEEQIRMYVKWNGNTLRFNVGYKISGRKWDKSSSRCKKSTTNKDGISSSEINKEISRMELLADDVFKKFEVEEFIPTAEEYKKEFNSANGRNNIGNISRDGIKFSECFDLYLSNISIMKSISDDTISLYRALKNFILKRMDDIAMEELDKHGPDDIIGIIIKSNLKTTSAKVHIKNLISFLRWSYKNGYIKNKESTNAEYRLKTVKNNDIVFLTWDELMRVYNLKLKNSFNRNVRDIFCFMCFTSLRISDVMNLKWSNIQEGEIRIVQKKTGKLVRIQINKYSKKILERQRKDNPNNAVFHKYFLNHLNNRIRIICEEAEINSPVTIRYYIGNRKHEVTDRKFKFVTSHCGRRTFISNALMMGIPATTVMSWTGHSSFNSMKPYINISKKGQEESMKLFDER